MSRIIMKKASPATAGRKPLAADLVLGEIAINPADGAIYTVKDLGGGSKEVVRVGTVISDALAATLGEPTGAAFLAAIGGGAGGLGGLDLIEARAATGGEQVFSGLSAYRDVMVMALAVNTSGAATLQMQVGDSTGMLTGNIYHHPSSPIGFAFMSDSTTVARSSQLMIHNFNKTDAVKPVTPGSARNTYTNWPIAIANATALDRLRVYCSTGTMNAGTIYLFGRTG